MLNITFPRAIIKTGEASPHCVSVLQWNLNFQIQEETVDRQAAACSINGVSYMTRLPSWFDKYHAQYLPAIPIPESAPIPAFNSSHRIAD